MALVDYSGVYTLRDIVDAHQVAAILPRDDFRMQLKKADSDFLESLQAAQRRNNIKSLPPLQVVLTKCDLVSQPDLARRMVQTRQQLSVQLQREPSRLPEMLVSSLTKKNASSQVGAGILELQRELAALATTTTTQSGR